MSGLKYKMVQSSPTCTLNPLPTDALNYVPFNSAHPKHVLRNVPYCLARKIRGIVSDGVLLELRTSELKKQKQKVSYSTD